MPKIKDPDHSELRILAKKREKLIEELDAIGKRIHVLKTRNIEHLRSQLQQMENEITPPRACSRCGKSDHSTRGHTRYMVKLAADSIVKAVNSDLRPEEPV